MSWIWLIFAGLMEVAGVVMMKQYAVHSKKIFLLGTGLCFALSIGLLSVAMQGISMSVAYAIWTGIGACGGVLMGIMYFKENSSFLKIFFILLILASSIGLKLLS